MISDDLRTAATRWIADDPSLADRQMLQALLDQSMGIDPQADQDGHDPVEVDPAVQAAAATELAICMAAPLAFGTAGLRGPLRPGPAGMNLAVVRRAAAGIASYLTDTDAAGGVVIVGYDARYRSREFAIDAARVLAAAGFTALLAPGPLPTPITAFAVQHLDAVAALQVTASHNPPRDNGLKVYLAGGAQIVAPVDAEIESHIAAQPAAIDIDASGAPQRWSPNIVQDYLDRVAELPRGSARVLSIAATPMHGVGGAMLLEALGQAEFLEVQLVPDQAAPDPDFPTVPFPNPEEPGAADMLLALAAAIKAEIAVALDPDADRCAIGIVGRDGAWRMLRGDETGALLGDYVLRTLDREAHPDPLVATTIVSSELLRHIAAAHGARYDETLTGFKWIVRAGDGAGTGLVYGYEEAIGHCVDPDFVRDKDGISTAMLMCDLAATLKSQGRTINDALDDLARTHGLHLTDQLAVRVDDVSIISDAMARLRASVPATLLGNPVTDVVDVLPRTDAIVLRTHHERVVVRPSGTEPKLKCYLEVVRPVLPDTTDLTELRTAAAADLAILRSEIAGVLGL